MGVLFQHRLDQLGADSLPLVLGTHQNILDQDHGMPIAYHPNQPQRRAVLVNAGGEITAWFAMT